MLTDDSPIIAVTEYLAAVIRQELPELLVSGQNWKMIINGSAGGDVTTVIEQHCVRVRRLQPVSQTK